MRARTSALAVAIVSGWACIGEVPNESLRGRVGVDVGTVDDPLPVLIETEASDDVGAVVGEPDEAFYYGDAALLIEDGDAGGPLVLTVDPTLAALDDGVVAIAPAAAIPFLVVTYYDVALATTVSLALFLAIPENAERTATVIRNVLERVRAWARSIGATLAPERDPGACPLPIPAGVAVKAGPSTLIAAAHVCIPPDFRSMVISPPIIFWDPKVAETSLFGLSATVRLTVNNIGTIPVEVFPNQLSDDSATLPGGAAATFELVVKSFQRNEVKFVGRHVVPRLLFFSPNPVR